MTIQAIARPQKWLNKGDSTIKSAEESQSGLAGTLASMFQTQYASQQNVLNFLQGQMKPLLNPNGSGFMSASQETSLRTSATEQNTQAFQDAMKGYQNRSFALGGRQFGNGVQDSNLARIGIAGAQQEAGSQNAITQLGAQMRLQNFWNASNSMMGVAGMQNPLGYSQGATSGFGNVGTLGVDYQKTKGPSFLSILGGLGSAAMGAFMPGGQLLGSFMKPGQISGAFGGPTSAEPISQPLPDQIGG